MESSKSLAWAIRKTDRNIKRFIDSRGKPCTADIPNATMNQGRIAGYIFDNSGHDVFQRDIEKEFDIRRSTATHTLKLMEKNGFIKRERTLYDERLKKITLTESTRAEMEEMSRSIEKTNMLLERGITGQERDVFLRVLDKINCNIEEAKKDA